MLLRKVFLGHFGASGLPLSSCLPKASGTVELSAHMAIPQGTEGGTGRVPSCRWGSQRFIRARVPWQGRHVEEEPITPEGSGHSVNIRKARLGDATERALGMCSKR